MINHFVFSSRLDKPPSVRDETSESKSNSNIKETSSPVSGEYMKEVNFLHKKTMAGSENLPKLYLKEPLSYIESSILHLTSKFIRPKFRGEVV